MQAWRCQSNVGSHTPELVSMCCSLTVVILWTCPNLWGEPSISHHIPQEGSETDYKAITAWRKYKCGYVWSEVLFRKQIALAFFLLVLQLIAHGSSGRHASIAQCLIFLSINQMKALGVKHVLWAIINTYLFLKAVAEIVWFLSWQVCCTHVWFVLGEGHNGSQRHIFTLLYLFIYHSFQSLPSY